MASPGSSGDIRNQSWMGDDVRRTNQAMTSMPPGFVAPAAGLWPENSDGGIASTTTTTTDASGTATGEQQERRRNERTSSFNNIAAALGSGLAESIEDATRGDHVSNHANTSITNTASNNAPANLTDSFFNPINNNNNTGMAYERHKRHTASRLIGATAGANSFPAINHKAPEAGSLFVRDTLNNSTVDTTHSTHTHPKSSFASSNGGNHAHTSGSDQNNIGRSSSDNGRLSGGLNADSSIGAPSPFSHDPNAAAFHPSYDQIKANSSSLQFNTSDQNNNMGDAQRNTNHGSKSRLPVTKDIGMTVSEPSDYSPYVGGASGGGSKNITNRNFSTNYGVMNHRVAAKPDANVNLAYGIQSDMQNLWSESVGGSSRGGGAGGGDLSPKPPSISTNRAVETIAMDGGVGVGDGNANRNNRSPPQAIDAEDDLRPFTWDINQYETSRTLVIFNAAAIPCNQIEELCDNFGAIESFRSEFWEWLGVIFISYFDMRSVQFAAMQLPRRLQSLNGTGGNVQVKYCSPLNSSSQNDESLVVVNDLPGQIGQNNLGSYVSQFGAIRSVRAGNYGSFVVEFNDVQDARKVVFELETRQPWGPDVSIEVGSRNPADRKKGRELLALLGRWRNQGGGRQGGSPNSRGRQPVNTSGSYRPHGDSRGGMGHRDGRYERGLPHEEHSQQLGYGPGPQDGRYHYGGGNTYAVHQKPHQHPGYSSYRGAHHPNDHIVHGGHGHHGTYTTRPVSHQPPPHQQQFYQQPQQINHGNFPGGSSVISGGSSRHTGTSGYYTDDRSIGSHTSHGSNIRSINSIVESMAGNSRDGQSQNLILDLELVENELDTRSSLMVRNIPNKYTQQMLLNEFTENGHGPGVIDFFYLPIDFKNRCNRGYAFINFVKYRDIVKFHRQYYGQHWRTFNSDKICDITYARIQTKASMLKRFENSALMEKDEEYKPLVFVSDGPEKGKRLPFPVSSRGS